MVLNRTSRRHAPGVCYGDHTLRKARPKHFVREILHDVFHLGEIAHNERLDGKGHAKRREVRRPVDPFREARILKLILQSQPALFQRLRRAEHGEKVLGYLIVNDGVVRQPAHENAARRRQNLARQLKVQSKRELAQAFIANKASMDLGDATDEWILSHVDDVAAVLMALTEHAIAIDDRVWLRRHVWFRALAYALSNDKPGTPLDG